MAMMLNMMSIINLALGFLAVDGSYHDNVRNACFLGWENFTFLLEPGGQVEAGSGQPRLQLHFFASGILRMAYQGLQQGAVPGIEIVQ